GCSPNYHGDPDLRANRSADILDEDNCSFWITNLPPDVTYTEFLSHIREIGRVFALSMTAPNATTGHETSAAKLVFFELRAAQLFWNRFPKYYSDGLVIRGYRAIIRHNRTKFAEITTLRDATRVVTISGPTSIVNISTLTKYFQARFYYETDDVNIIVKGQNFSVIEYRFSSYRAQAESAHRSLTTDVNMI
ncbi:hypothetical protein B0T26DRAFT_611648, partial [Lasiosphaeria miniovina]